MSTQIIADSKAALKFKLPHSGNPIGYNFMIILENQLEVLSGGGTGPVRWFDQRYTPGGKARRGQV